MVKHELGVREKLKDINNLDYWTCRELEPREPSELKYDRVITDKTWWNPKTQEFIEIDE